MDKDMETWMRTWKHRREHGNMDKDMDIWTRTWRLGRGHGDMDEDIHCTRRSVYTFENCILRSGPGAGDNEHVYTGNLYMEFTNSQQC
jgi:hypothetical protein